MQFTDWIEALAASPGTRPPLWDNANTTYEDLIKNDWIEPCGNGFAVTPSGLKQMRSWQKK